MLITKKEINEKKHFDSHAGEYDRNYRYVEPFTKYKIEKKFNSLVKFIKSNYGNKPIKILEIGCGTGEYTKKIAKRFPKSKIVALDISPKILKIAKDKCKGLKNTSFVCKSAYQTKMKNETFDIIVGYYILHHIDLLKFAREAKRILKSGGLVYFYEPNILNPVVFLIKSNKWLKTRLGDSPDEWAVNPIKIGNDFRGFSPVLISTSEYLWPIRWIDSRYMIMLDKITSYFKYIPLLKYIGGSVELIFKKIK